MKRITVMVCLLVASVAYATTITDDFNRANASTLGANWTVAHGISLEVVSNAAENSVFDGTYDGNFHATTLATADQYVQAVINGKGANNYFDLKLRTDGVEDTWDGYQAGVGATQDYFITRYDNGTGTDLVTGTTTFADGDTLRVEISGTTLTLKINGVTVNTASDSTYATGAYVGVGIYDGTDASPRFDDFSAGDLSAGSGPTIPITLQNLGKGYGPQRSQQLGGLLQ